MLKWDSGELGNGSAFMKVIPPIYGLYGVDREFKKYFHSNRLPNYIFDLFK